MFIMNKYLLLLVLDKLIGLYWKSLSLLLQHTSHAIALILGQSGP